MAERDDRPGLILASGSRTRLEMLQAAGVAFTVVPADIDEAGAFKLTNGAVRLGPDLGRHLIDWRLSQKDMAA